MRVLPRWFLILFFIVLIFCLSLASIYFYLQNSSIKRLKPEKSSEYVPFGFSLNEIPNDDFNEIFISGYPITELYQEDNDLFIDFMVPFDKEKLVFKMYLGEPDDTILARLIRKDIKSIDSSSQLEPSIIGEAVEALNFKERLRIKEQIKLGILIPKNDFPERSCSESCQKKMDFYKEHKEDFDLLLKLAQNEKKQTSNKLIIGPVFYIMLYE